MNESALNWYGLKDPELKQISLGTSSFETPYDEAPSKNMGFQWTGFMRPINQHGQVAHLYLLGNMAVWNPKRQARLTGITGV